VHTHWLTEDDDLATVLDQATAELRRDTDTVAVSEKVAVLLTGRSIDSGTVSPGRLARYLAGNVRTIGNSRGLSIPEKMQLVLQQQGRARVVLAALSSALLRRLGRRGDFYRLAGNFARDLDGMRPPYLGTLLPPLTPSEAQQLAEQLEQRLDTGVAIVDINDRGGSVRAVSSRSLPPADLRTALGDNPMGQGTRGVPFVLVRQLPAGGPAPEPAGQQAAEHHGELDQLGAAQQPQGRQVDDEAGGRRRDDREHAVPGAGHGPGRHRGEHRGDGHLCAAPAHPAEAEPLDGPAEAPQGQDRHEQQ
jgi:F420-0:gamma-glutamyl ligase